RIGFSILCARTQLSLETTRARSNCRLATRWSRLATVRAVMSPLARGSAPVVSRTGGIAKPMRGRFIQLAVFYAVMFSSCARQGAEVSRWENSDSAIHVRVIERAEVGNFMNGAYYVFESRSPTDNDWHYVMTFRQDDQVDIPKESVSIKNSSLAYVAMGWMFAVTTDSGRTWSVWNAKGDLPGWN